MAELDEFEYVYKHNKTGELYEIMVDNMVRTCNGHEGEIMVCYEKVNARMQDHKLFVRNKKEFLEKFTKYNGDI